MLNGKDCKEMLKAEKGGWRRENGDRKVKSWEWNVPKLGKAISGMRIVTCEKRPTEHTVYTKKLSKRKRCLMARQME